jgi:hypothetical protein
VLISLLPLEPRGGGPGRAGRRRGPGHAVRG